MSGVISGAVSLQLLIDLALETNDAGKLLKLWFFFKKKKCTHCRSGTTSATTKRKFHKQLHVGMPPVRLHMSTERKLHTRDEDEVTNAWSCQ